MTVKQWPSCQAYEWSLAPVHTTDECNAREIDKKDDDDDCADDDYDKVVPVHRFMKGRVIRTTDGARRVCRF